MAPDVLSSIYHLPSAEVKAGNYVLIHGRPCKVKSIHHVIFSTPVVVQYGHRTVEIRGVDMLTKTNCNWIGYGYEKINLFYPSADKFLFITLTEKFVLGLNSRNKMMCIPLAKNDPLRSIISSEKWSGDLHVLKVPVIIDEEMEEAVMLEKVIPWT